LSYSSKYIQRSDELMSKIKDVVVAENNDADGPPATEGKKNVGTRENSTMCKYTR